MFKIDSSGNVAGYFDDGVDETTGKYPTIVTAQWLNAVQDELVNVAVALGVALDKSNTHQVLTAIQTMILNAVAYSEAGLQSQVDAHSSQIANLTALVNSLKPHITPILGGRWLHQDQYDATYYVKPMGQSLLRADYPDAWTAVQASGMLAASHADWLLTPTMWGPGADATHFDVPDLRALFLRVDGADKAGNPAPGLGGYKANQNKAHTHALPTSGSGAEQTIISDMEAAVMTSKVTGSSGGDEANPDHTTLRYVIRLK